MLYKVSTAEENRGEMLNLVDGGSENVGFQGCFARCRLDVTDLARERVPVRWASKREESLTVGFSFCVGYFENDCVCRRAKLSRGGVYGQELRNVGWRRI